MPFIGTVQLQPDRLILGCIRAKWVFESMKLGKNELTVSTDILSSRESGILELWQHIKSNGAIVHLRLLLM